MAEDKQQNSLENDLEELPLDEELFSGQVQEDLTEQDIFAGDEDFYRFLTESILDKATQSPHARVMFDKPTLLPSLPKRFANLQKVIAAVMIILAVVLIYSIMNIVLPGYRPYPPSAVTPQNTTQQPNNQVTTQQADMQPISTATQKPQPELPANYPLSLETAQKLYQLQDYEKAYAVYEQLLQEGSYGDDKNYISDFLSLKMALCMKKASDSWHIDAETNAEDIAYQLLKGASQSRSPIINALANYHLCLVERQKSNYLKAATRTYRTLTLIAAVEDRDLVMSLQQNCNFLSVECLTRHVLSLSDADKDLPRNMWADYDEVGVWNQAVKEFSTWTGDSTDR
ncbi:MAG: hypothetical protein ACYTBP_02030 [Planctomycetota bacterium]|jgi:hypothetical protein